MIGPTVDRSTADGELVGDVVFGDATALTTGGLLTGATLDGTEATGALLVADAE
ncbi:MAG TPA: hypothetical protein VFG00_13160 [Acidothermaceae bacterium]|nr:hypothetical protein [Acidothermaceae bacterium]